MNPGILDRQLVLLKRTSSLDAAGAPVQTWAVFERPWAQRVNQPAGGESFTADAKRVAITDTFRIRYNAALPEGTAPGDFRVSYDGRVYDLQSVAEDIKQPRRAYQLLGCAYLQGQVYNP